MFLLGVRSASENRESVKKSSFQSQSESIKSDDESEYTYEDEDEEEEEEDVKLKKDLLSYEAQAEKILEGDPSVSKEVSPDLVTIPSNTYKVTFLNQFFQHLFRFCCDICFINTGLPYRT